jgi:phosphotransferase system enzyme I (PtsP)
MKKDTVDLICSVGELASLFESDAGLKGFLQKVVSLVAYHMKAAVCSVYMFDEATEELVLTANQGLNPDCVGKLRLKLGEGITGLAVKELRAIREGRGSSSPFYKYIPGTGEERYEAFLVVPILNGNQRVGALVVQDPQPDYFDDNDVKALRAITAQLANTIESAKLLMSLHEPAAPLTPTAGAITPSSTRIIHGIVACEGIALGRALDITANDQGWLTDTASASSLTEEDFLRALRKTEEQLAELQRQLGERMSDVASLVFDAHVLILKDSGFSGEMQARIQQGHPPDQAIRNVIQMYVDLFSNSSNPALREKTHDVRDLGLRLLSNLLMRTSESVDYHGRIIVADDLLPSDILKLSAQRAEGVVLIGGGVTAHISVLARSLRMPLVIVKEALLTREEKAQGPFIILDADQGNVLINQTADVVRQYQALLIARAESDSANTRVTPTTTTLDGQRIRLMANINLLSELPSAQRLKAEGIGLYRSEFPFIVRKSIPTEEEQFRIYRKVLESMPDHEVLLRTLDVGGDKILPFFPVLTEANPFLGLRALRFSMRNKEIFIQQLRAMLRAGATCPLSIMFPLVMSLEDFEEAREMVSASIRALQEEHLPCNEAPRLGVMIEVPSAVELAVELARAADFLCIGSNDLIQYTLAVDRTNPNIANLFTPHHPAVLRAIGRVAEAAASQGKPVSLCGDMATDERLIPFLVGVGIQSFSMDPKYIPRIQQVIAALSFNDARRLAREILQLGRVKAIEARLSIAP